MGSSRVIDTSVAIQEGRNLHGDKYDYTLLEYVNYQTPLKIICPEHGLFEQKYQKHCKLGRGCQKCGAIKGAISQSFTREIFIKKANLIHNNFYDYSKVVYINNHTRIIIGCPIHGDFFTTPAPHLKGVNCSKCARIKRDIASRKSIEDILVKFKGKHGEFYKYDIPEEVKTTDKIAITCPIHGEFQQIVAVHYNSGCPVCGDIRIGEHQRTIPIELTKVCRNIKRRVKGFIKSEGYKKTSPTSQIIGIDWMGLKEYLENNPYGFKVDCVDLDIDHIIPLSSIREEEDIYKLNHYTNLQLLPRIYNQFIKKKKPFDKLDFEKWLVETDYKEC